MPPGFKSRQELRMKSIPSLIEPRCSREQADQQKSHRPRSFGKRFISRFRNLTSLFEPGFTAQAASVQFRGTVRMLIASGPSTRFGLFLVEIRGQDFDSSRSERRDKRLSTNTETYRSLSRLEKIALVKSLTYINKFPLFSMKSWFFFYGLTPVCIERRAEMMGAAKARTEHTRASMIELARNIVIKRHF